MGEEVHFPRCGKALSSARHLPEAWKRQLLTINRRSFEDDRETIYLQPASPDSFQPRPGRFNVGLTMTERESLAGYSKQFDWVGLCNSMDLIVTPTAWNKEVFEQNGIKRVAVVPLGIEADFWRPMPFRFLSGL